MSTQIQELTVRIGGNIDEILQSLDRVGQAARRMGDNIKKVGTSLTKSVTAPLMAAGAGLTALAVKVGETADEILSLQDATGLGAEMLQELRHIATIVGTDQDAVADAAQRLTTRLKAAGEESQAVQRTLGMLGVSARNADGSLRGMDELLPEIITKLQGVEDVTTRNSLAVELFGRGASNIAGVLAMSAEEFDEARRQAHELGLVLSTESLQAADEFRVQWQTLANQLSAAGARIGMAVIPILSDLASWAQERVVPAVERLINWFSRVSPTAKVVGASIAAIAAAAGPVLIVLGQLAQSLGNLIPIVTKVGAALSGPLLLQLGAVAAALTAAVLIWRQWGDDIKFVVVATVSVIQERLEPIAEFFGSLFNAILMALQRFRDAALKPLLQFAARVADIMIERVGSILSGVIRIVRRFAELFAPGLARGLDAIERFVDDVKARVAELRDQSQKEADGIDESMAKVEKAARRTRTVLADPTDPEWLKAAKRASEELATSLRTIPVLQQILGDSFDATAERASAYERAVRALVSAGVSLDAVVGPQGETLRELANTWLDLRAGVEKAAEEKRAFEEAVRAAQQAVAATATEQERYAATIGALDTALAAGKITQEEHARAVRHAREEFLGVTDAMRTYEGLIRESLTPTERYREVMGQLRLLLAEGKINQEQFARASQQAAEILEEGRPKIENLGNAMRRVGDQGLDAIADFAMGSRDAIRNFVQDALRQLARLAVRMLAFRLISGLATGGASEFTGFGVGVGIPGMAEGGPIRARMPVIVGERGPELIVPRSPGNVVPNDQLRGMLSTGPSVDEVIAGVLERVGPPPGPMPPEVAATHDWYRRLFSAAVIDARERGVRFG